MSAFYQPEPQRSNETPLATDTSILSHKLQPAKMDASDPSRAECLPETRTALIDSIAEWAFDPNTHTKVLWLHGLAGSGKSTLSTTIANLFRVMGSLGAFLFFDRAMAERRDPSTVIRTWPTNSAPYTLVSGSRLLKVTRSRDYLISLLHCVLSLKTFLLMHFLPEE